MRIIERGSSDNLSSPDSFRRAMEECGVVFGKPGHLDTSQFHGQYLYALLRLATSDIYCTCEQLG